ncbi:hypothetical protein IGK71_000147 [Enterococcus sp. DIV0343]
MISKDLVKQSDGYSSVFWDQSAMDTSKIDKTYKNMII